MSPEAAARQGLRSVLLQMSEGADTELTIQVLKALTGEDKGLDVATSPEGVRAVEHAQELCSKLAEVV